MTTLHRYWIECDAVVGSQRRWGVTALSLADAIALIAASGGPDVLPDDSRVVEDVDVSTLDRKHMAYAGPPNWRGV